MDIVLCHPTKVAQLERLLTDKASPALDAAQEGWNTVWGMCPTTNKCDICPFDRIKGDK